jgi:hypothetical protein
VRVVDDPTKLLTARGADEAAARDLPLRLDLRAHSPSGFEWGYGGSGPAQLALALLADALGDVELAQEHYQNFKWAVVSRLGDCWRLSARDMQRFVAQRRGRQRGLETQQAGGA